MQKNTRSTEQALTPKSDVAVAVEQLAKVLALGAVRAEKRDDQITFLHCLGYPPAEIATLLDTSSNTVSVALYQRKRKQSKPKRSKK